jgi:transcriptional regulator with XRE-family HTH domain
MMNSAQCRAARALLNWSQQQLANAAKIGNATIRNFEAGRSEPQHATLDVLRRTFEAAGVVFIPENGGGAGVRLKFNRREVRGIDILENEGGIVGEDDR